MKLRGGYILAATWVTIAAAGLFLYFFRRNAIQGELHSVLAFSLMGASLVYVLLGTVRALTLIPSTYLVIAALPFFPPFLLFGLSLIGILSSSAIVYLLAASFGFEERFEKGKHHAQVAKLRAALERHELPIIIGWSFFPLAPTDLICYVCGVLDINFPKFLLGILLGEGALCALYVFAGDSVLRVLQVRP
ncbi:MAG TPA: VTT domain-containing protein [Gemmatimonadales bacterium]|jgi:uncharacterized membrane protein YdjX (TVP38/TMEM64 family)|nr:VTT domain-containing protein [Gemmatimonadales bacterium]